MKKSNSVNQFLYLVFLLPISVLGLSANYLFAVLYLRATFIKPKDGIILLFLIFFILSYFVGAIIYSKGDSFFLLRQFISFSLFLSLYLLLFIKIKISLEDLLNVVVFISTLYSLHVIYVIYTNSAFSLSDIYFIKGGLREYVSDWPQRYVVLLVFSFIVSFSQVKQKAIYLLTTFVIGAAIMLTFTRSAYLSVTIGMFSYFLLSVKNKPKLTYRSVIYFLIFITTVIYVFTLNKQMLSGIENIYTRTFDAVELFFSSGGGHVGSDSDRLRYWASGFEVLEKNIISGTGFAGIYLFHPIGSIHSQYMDILLRLGVVGLSFYLYLWIKMFRYYYHYSIPVFSGLVAIFVFGFTHETTKLTYVGLLFFVLLNFSIHKKVIKCAV